MRRAAHFNFLADHLMLWSDIKLLHVIILTAFPGNVFSPTHRFNGGSMISTAELTIANYRLSNPIYNYTEAMSKLYVLFIMLF